MSESDSQLVVACQGGDMGALKALYDRYVDRVWRLGYLRTRSRDAAEDVVQETFLRVARSIGRFEGRSSFGTYLFAVARSVIVDRRRKQRCEQSLEDEPTVLKLVPAAPAPVGSDESTRDAVRQAVAKLPSAQYDAIVLYELSDLSIGECAEVLGWGESRVKITLFRARRKLKAMLERQVDFGGQESGVTGREPKGRRRDAGAEC